jgi:hypothetical protein
MSRHTSKIMSPKSKRVILYRGSPPTSAQMKFKSSCKNSVVAVDETGSICYLEAGKDAKRISFTVVGSLIWDSRRFKDVIKKFRSRAGK